MKITHILHPTDFSDSSAAAMDYVKTLAKQYDSEITMMYVMDELDNAKGWYVPHISLDEFYKDMETAAAKKLEHCCYEGLREMKKVNRVVVKGEPEEEIVKYAKTHGVDMIVMGTHSKSGMDFFFGSVTEKVIRGAECPVLCVKTKPK